MADTQPTPDPAPQPEVHETETSPAENTAESMAAEALRAAQDAVAALKQQVPQGGDADPLGMGSGAPTSPLDFPALSPSLGAGRAEPIDLLADVNLNVKIELGRTRMLVEDVLRLGEGSVVELDKLAGDPVDVYVNERHVARGEVLVLNDNFCVRINEIIPQTSGSTKQ
ncbi:MAG: flagellar motor switch protein FliN [Phycisphaeraceae bacterium]|nr:flagellar motor switch protein FliN [Phycisphaeraceae bacterium]